MHVVFPYENWIRGREPDWNMKYFVPSTPPLSILKVSQIVPNTLMFYKQRGSQPVEIFEKLSNSTRWHEISKQHLEME